MTARDELRALAPHIPAGPWATEGSAVLDATGAVVAVTAAGSRVADDPVADWIAALSPTTVVGLLARPAATSDARKRLAESAPAEPDADERDALRDEIAGWPIGGGYYATQIAVDEATELADAILAAGYSRTPDAHLAAAKAEVLEEAARKIPAQVAIARHIRERIADWLRARAARLREQGGDR